jgi:hypothetical protein
VEHRGAVQAAAEGDGDRQVRLDALAHRLLEQLAEMGDDLVLRCIDGIVAEAEVAADPLLGDEMSRRKGLDLAREGGEAFLLGREVPGAVYRGVVERLDPDMVPRREERAARPVVDDEGEHPIQLLQETFPAPLPVPVDEHLGVGPGMELISRGDQFLLEIPEVVDLSVEDGPDGAGGV